MLQLAQSYITLIWGAVATDFGLVLSSQHCIIYMYTNIYKMYSSESSLSHNPQGQNVLHHGFPSTQRTLGFLSHPVTNAFPAENMPTLSGGRVFQLFQAQCTLPLLASLDIIHDFGVLQIESRATYNWRVRCGGEVDPAGLRTSAAELREQKVAVGRVGVFVVQ